MSLVRLLGFTTLPCGCVIGRYREVATNREVVYVEEKGATCDQHGQPHAGARPGRRGRVGARRGQGVLIDRSSRLPLPGGVPAPPPFSTA